MAETISLEVQGNVPKEVLTRLHSEITPRYIYELLEKNNMPTDPATVDNVITPYRMGFPTQDSALSMLETEKGIQYWGIATGSASRIERVLVKYFILKRLQSEFRTQGISAELNIAGLNLSTVEHMIDRGMLEENQSELPENSDNRGNLEGTVLGIYAPTR